MLFDTLTEHSFGSGIGAGKDYAATTVSYRLNLHGPSEAIRDGSGVLSPVAVAN